MTPTRLTGPRFDPVRSYRQVATQTASRGQLVLMLYDGAIRFLEQARAGFTKDDPLEYNLTINNSILRAQAILQELNESLNMEAGGPFALTMRSLYDYMDNRLYDANQYKKEDGVMDVLRRLNILRDAWAEMLDNQGKETGIAVGPDPLQTTGLSVAV